MRSIEDGLASSLLLVDVVVLVVVVVVLERTWHRWRATAYSLHAFFLLCHGWWEDGIKILLFNYEGEILMEEKDLLID